MSNSVFLWVFRCGIELGVIVLLLLPLRAILKRTAPRIFSYLLWGVLPLIVICKWFIERMSQFGLLVEFHVSEIPFMAIPEMILQAGKGFLLIGTACVFLFMVYFYVRLWRRLVGSIRLRENIYITERIKSPFSMGLIHPKIFLPSSLEEEYYAPVIMHEKVHIARKDIWMKHIGMALLMVFWFQPLLWLAFYLFVNDMEEACDEAVLRKNTKVFQMKYAKALVEVSYQAGKVGGVAIGYGSGEIKGRVKHALAYKRSSLFVKIGATLACVGFMCLAVLLSRQVPRIIWVVDGAKGNVSAEGLVIREEGMTEQLIFMDELE